MKRSVFWLWLFSAAFLWAQNTDLYELAKIQQNVKSRRVSSYDRSGGNNDRFEHLRNVFFRALLNLDGAANEDKEKR